MKVKGVCLHHDAGVLGAVVPPEVWERRLNNLKATLTADAALLLAKLSDAELAPLEAAAEDVGVDPAPYYTTRTLGEAFLAKCDFERLRSFEPKELGTFIEY